jgi:hypothetical protein
LVSGLVCGFAMSLVMISRRTSWRGVPGGSGKYRLPAEPVVWP